MASNPWYGLNILFVFAGATQLLALSRKRRIGALLPGILLLICLVPLLTPASYGLQGLLLAVSAALYLKPSTGKASCRGAVYAERVHSPGHIRGRYAADRVSAYHCVSRNCRFTHPEVHTGRNGAFYAGTFLLPRLFGSPGITRRRFMAQQVALSACLMPLSGIEAPAVAE